MYQQSIDYKETYYSRQAVALGLDTQQKIEELECFIYGLRGLGLEIAKNLILMGLKRVMIYDKTIVSILDLGTNFYGKFDQVGSVARDQGLIESLKDLNENVIVEIYNGNINGNNLKQFSIVVMTDIWDQQLIEEINEATRQQGNGFILAHSSGLFGSIFVDFTDNFIIQDNNGEICKEILIEYISNDQKGIVNTQNQKHKFQDGDYIIFKEVQGMSEINDQVFKITVVSPYSFSIGDTSKFSSYERNGIAIQVKIPEKISFKSFKNMINFNKEEMQYKNLEKLDRSNQLQIVYNSIFNFMKELGRLPNLLNNNDADLLLKLVQQINQDLQQELDIQLIKNISLYLQAQIIPLTSFWGGLVAQEVIKFTGKYTPIRQWFHLEFYEALPEIEVNRNMLNNQYDNYIAIFGQEIIENLQNQNILLMGAGGLGNEYLKIFTLLGIGSGLKGQLIIADEDQIELSNLNRQFLFKQQHINSNKAITACSTINQINKSIKCKPFPNYISKQNEQIFNMSFWNNLHIVVNAVDNIKSRHYIDSQCCYYKKPIFESGSEGTKSHSQVIIPFLTESFSESQDSSELVNLKSNFSTFPYLTEHIIEWALNYFLEKFQQTSNDLYQFSQSPSNFLKEQYSKNQHQLYQLKEKLEQLDKYLFIIINPTLENIIKFAINLFQFTFYDQIKNLLNSFPSNYKLENGQLFWTNPRRQPITIQFDQLNSLHQQFINCTVNIIFQMIGQSSLFNYDQILVVLNQLTNNNIEQIEQINQTIVQLENQENSEHQIQKEVETLIVKFENLFSQNQNNFQKVQCLPFQKNKLNYLELQFILSAANLRSINYNLPKISKFQVRQQIEHIFPQLITTKAVITGLVAIEILKYIQQKNIIFHRNTFVNLALPIFVFSQIKPPNKNIDQEFNILLCDKTKAIPDNWTIWDIIKINKKMTIREIIEYFEQNYNVNVSFICFNNYIVYSKKKKTAQDFFQRDCADLYSEISKQKLPEHEINFDVLVDSTYIIDGQEVCVDFPPIKYHYKI
ncbi:unnamed protein product [Paramecium sonneborni]|uniref:Ubiquitin-activating enzyme E1 C-terminal domain-containing protein n=1 Tax=Paramecium sonneborni TaxID=65129 RepID=A0A8S1KLE7_9CILI|nr:unnamed protein product [Paramecium sonneborni]